MKDVLTLSLSDLRRDPHSALLDTGGDGHGLAGGRLSLGEPLTACILKSFSRTIKSRVPRHVAMFDPP